MLVVGMEKKGMIKLIEWNPLFFGSSSRECLPNSYSMGLTVLTLALLFPMGVLGLFSADWPISYQLFPLYLSLFLFGMPHGGADHLLIWGMIRKSTWLFRVSTLLLYPTLSVLYLICWHFQPVASAIFFLAITIFHWGQGDRYISVKLHRASYLERSSLLMILHIMARGSIPILLPGFLGNETYRLFLEAMIRQGGQVDYDLTWVSQNHFFFLLVPLIFISLQLFFSMIQLQKDEKVAWGLDLAEACFLFSWFLFLPPLWALGIYFALWHSLRHGLRIIWMDPTGKKSLLTGAYLKLKARWLQISGLMTILALVGLWFLLALPLSFRGIQLDWLGKAMLGISILTLPHTVVVCLMDRFQLKK
jgi:Brp/Blh family beta-carotene 15,15'-monooxygenase